MHMETEAIWTRLDDGTASDVALDFSGVRRIDPAGLQALEKLVRAAEDTSGKVTLRGVNVAVYKVLKLMKLAPRLSFTN